MPQPLPKPRASRSLLYGAPAPHAAPPARLLLRCAESAPERQPQGSAPKPRTEEAALRSDALAVSLRGALDLTTAPLARSAAAFVDSEGWTAFGYARLEDHARERFGRSGRWLRDLAALGRMFSTLPGLEEALCGMDRGRPLGRVAGLLVGRVADPASVAGWVALARSVSVRELRDAVAAAREAGSAGPLNHHEMEVAVGDSIAITGGATVHGAPATATGSAAPALLASPAGSDGSMPGETPGEDEDRTLVRLTAPLAVLAAFDEALDLYRAVEGREATVTSFVEALIAEAFSSGDLAEAVDGVNQEPLGHGESVAAEERAHACSTRQWEQLPAVGQPDWALRLAGSSLEELRGLLGGAGRGGAMELDGQIQALLRIEDEIETRLASLLAQMADDEAWCRLRFASVVHYAEQRLGLGRTAARMRVRVARALRRLPLVRAAYERGEVGMEAAWLVATMVGAEPADEATQRIWIERGRQASVKRLRDEARLAGRIRAGLVGREDAGLGDDPEAAGTAPPPSAPCGPAAGAPAGPTSPLPGIDGTTTLVPRLPATDEAWHASLRREVGTARARVAALGRLAAASWVSDVFLRLRLPAALASDFLGAIESAQGLLDRRAAEVPWEEPWPERDPPESLIAARDFFIRCRRTPAWVGLMALLEEFVATWDVEADAARRPGQPIFIRDGWRCAAPGCTSRRNLEEHHVRYRSRGGGEGLSNRVTLCRFHHQRGEHGGLARCRGRAPLDLIWMMGAGGCGGTFRNEIRLEPSSVGWSARGLVRVCDAPDR